jgi:hypothetical protein
MDTAGAMNRLAAAIGLRDCASGEASSYERDEVARQLRSIGDMDAQTRRGFPSWKTQPGVLPAPNGNN